MFGPDGGFEVGWPRATRDAEPVEPARTVTPCCLPNVDLYTEFASLQHEGIRPVNGELKSHDQ